MGFEADRYRYKRSKIIQIAAFPASTVSRARVMFLHEDGEVSSLYENADGDWVDTDDWTEFFEHYQIRDEESEGKEDRNPSVPKKSLKLKLA